MKIQFTQEAWKDFEWFLDKDKRMVKRIRELLKDILRHPDEGGEKSQRYAQARDQRDAPPQSRE